MQVNNFIRKVWKNLLDLAFPNNYNITYINKLSVEDFLCLTKPAIKPILPNTLSILDYKNKLTKKAILSLKFENNRQVTKLFSQIIYDYLIEELADLKLTINFDKPILISIPLHRTRLKKRGYNQVDLIAQKIAKIDQNTFLTYKQNILKKIKNTPSQALTKNKQERLNNLKDCFKLIKPEEIKNQNIILLDDIITTGATLKEAVKTLEQGQPKQIICVTLAH